MKAASAIEETKNKNESFHLFLHKMYKLTLIWAPVFFACLIGRAIFQARMGKSVQPCIRIISDPNFIFI